MALNGVERANYISYLRDQTDYTYKYIRNLPDDTLYHLAKRIEIAIPQYIDEIVAKVSEKDYVGRRYTKEELKEYSYNELASIRKSLGIRKGKKKVTKVEKAPEKTVEQAKSAIHQMTLDELEKNIFDHEEFLSEKELAAAYGEDKPSDKELRAKGIINLDENEKAFKDVLRKRLLIKKEILKVIKKISQTMPIALTLSLEEINALNFDELVSLYRQLNVILPSIPSVETIEEAQESKLRMS